MLPVIFLTYVNVVLIFFFYNNKLHGVKKKYNTGFA